MTQSSIRFSALLLALLAPCGDLFAQQVQSQERFRLEFTVNGAGSVIIENPVGRVEVVGTDEGKPVVVAEKKVRAVNQAALTEGREQTGLLIAGDEQQRVIRTALPPFRSARWSSVVNYVVRVPRSVDVKIVSNTSDQVKVTDIRGTVLVRNFSGTVLLEQLYGPVAVESVNGNILFHSSGPILSNARLSTVNGNIEVRAPAEASFQWEASTMMGDLRTTFPVHGAFHGLRYRGNINEPGGPTITTETFRGNVHILRMGTTPQLAQSVRREVREMASASADMPVRIQAGPTTKHFQQESVQSSFSYGTLIGNISIGTIRGNARLSTGAGEVQLGTVTGDCNVLSLGGPLNLGEILGTLTARTEGGDVHVQAAREGGNIYTGGGIIRLLYTGGPTRLQSDGGDIVVRQAAGPVIAETKSGDISLTMDPNARSQKLTARTQKGNVTLALPPRFGADVEAVVITNDPDTRGIRSDFSGLSFQREQIAGGKTRIRATGKINGGGERMELFAENGRIQITSSSSNPMTVAAPR